MNRLTGGPNPVLKMRNGLIFYTANIYQTIPILSEIFKHKVYGDLTGLPSTATIVDVGAYIGTFALYAAQKYPYATIYAFEPEPSNYQMLVKNIGANHFSNIIPIPMAIDAVAGEQTLYVRGAGYGTNSLHQASGTPIEVSVTTLRDFFSERNIVQCDFLKLDCEGCELDILKDLPLEVKSVAAELPRNSEPIKLSVPFLLAPKLKTIW